MTLKDLLTSAVRASRPVRSVEAHTPAEKAAQILAGLAYLRAAIDRGEAPPDEITLRVVGLAARLAMTLAGTPEPSPHSVTRGAGEFSRTVIAPTLPAAVDFAAEIVKAKLAAWEEKGAFEMTAEEAYRVAGAVASTLLARSGR